MAYDHHHASKILHALGVGTLPGTNYPRSYGLMEARPHLLAELTSRGIHSSRLQLSQAPHGHISRRSSPQQPVRLHVWTHFHLSTRFPARRTQARASLSLNICALLGTRLHFFQKLSITYRRPRCTQGPSRLVWTSCRPYSWSTELILTPSLTSWCHVAHHRAQQLRFTPVTQGKRDCGRHPRQPPRSQVLPLQGTLPSNRTPLPRITCRYRTRLAVD